MISEGLLEILTGRTMAAVAKSSFEADAAGVLGPGSTDGMLMLLLGLGLAALGMWGRKKISQRTPVHGR